MPYHVIYAPYGSSPSVRSDQIIDFFEARTPHAVLERCAASPSAIAMELEADTLDDAVEELDRLGFIH